MCESSGAGAPGDSSTNPIKYIKCKFGLMGDSAIPLVPLSEHPDGSIPPPRSSFLLLYSAHMACAEYSATGIIVTSMPV